MCVYLVRQKSTRDWLRHNTKTLYGLLIPLSLGMAYLVSLGYGFNHVRVLFSFEMTAYGFTLVALFYACLLLIAVVDKASVIARVLRTPILCRLGVIAYGIYLFHPVIRQIALELIFGHDTTKIPIIYQNLISVGAFFVTWQLTIWSWRFFEGPIIQWGHLFRYQVTRGTAKQSADLQNLIPEA